MRHRNLVAVVTIIMYTSILTYVSHRWCDCSGWNLIELCGMLNALSKRQKWNKWPWQLHTLNATRQRWNGGLMWEAVGQKWSQPKIQITNAICTANNEQFGSNLKTQNEECVLKIKNLRRDLEFEKGEIRHCFTSSFDATWNILSDNVESSIRSDNIRKRVIYRVDRTMSILFDRGSYPFSFCFPFCTRLF